MTFLNRIFGGGKKEKAPSGVLELVEDTIQELLKVSGLELNADLNSDEGNILVELSGPDEEFLTSKEGQLLDSIQLFLQRVVQHQFPEDRTNVQVDSAGFREQANAALIELADKLREIALSKGKSVYFRALPPKDRKVVHQYLAEDGRVKSRSIGEGHFKKIKIYPVKENENPGNEEPY
jgi:spoIIIJ-associated protein